MNSTFWRGRRVLVTGHTGFKGAWLSLWLKRLGAEVSGLALAPDGAPHLYGLAGVDGDVRSTIADIQDGARVESAMRAARPEIVLHLAAQSLVRKSYRDPVETFAVNTLGPAIVLNAARQSGDVRAIVIVTSDKCYENREWLWPYRENEPMGGHDPYSASKGAAELVAQAMRRSYFRADAADAHPARVATARAGNVIGGGDFSEDRLIPDLVRGAASASGEAVLRNPKAVRPWQHALDPLCGYLMLAERLCTQPEGGFDEGWNFGPDNGDARAVGAVAQDFMQALGAGTLVHRVDPNAPHEAHLLQLDSAKARAKLGWRPALALPDAIGWTADWYKAWRGGADMRAHTLGQIDAYMARLEDVSA
ncbi:MAG: CDP-glucose 4,6-dehydratase [Alphaproteobacteria bacterium]|nr:CDP-glucose 4,6-dehydratase [Alphaproteobacteria bacterium]